MLRRHTVASHRALSVRPRATLTMLLLAALPLALLAGAAPAQAARPNVPFTVLAAGDLRGELKPCGCSPEGQMGGLPRRLSYLDDARQGRGAMPIRVDLGNNFPPADAQGREKITVIRELMGRNPPDAVLPGPGEIALGVAELTGPAAVLTYVLSNDADGTSFPPVRRVTRAGRTVGIYGYLSPDTVFQGMQTRLRLRRADAGLLRDLRAHLRRANDDATLLLFRGGDAELRELATSGLFSAIVVGNPSDDENVQVTERTVAGLRIPQVPTKGQGLVRFVLPMGPQDQPAPPFEVDWLTERWPDHPAAVKALATYDERVKALFFARLEVQQRTATESAFAGAAACQACHLKQHQTWSGTRHAHALATLERVGKQYDPECLACHVVGLNRNGFLSKDLTPQYANVQCENCHGPGKAHAAVPTTRPGPVPTVDGSTPPKPTEATCRTCHMGGHSPKFDFAVYWPKVAHPNPAPATAGPR